MLSVEGADVTDGSPEGIDGSCADAPEMGLELGKSHFDRVEVRTVRRQEQEPGSALLEDRLGLCALVAGQVVEDHHVAGLPRWGEGYSSGMSLGDSTFFGRQAGANAAAVEQA